MEYNRIVKAMLVAGFALNVNIALAAEALKIKTEDFTNSQGSNKTDLYDKTKIANEDKFGEAKDESIFLADEENKAGSNAKTQIQYNYNTAVGSRAVAGGTGNTAIGFATITGSNSQNDNSQATAIGYRSFAQGKESTAVRNDAVAWGHGAISIGSDNIPSGKYNRPLSFDTWLLFRHDRENFNYTADYLVIKSDDDMDKDTSERNKKIQDYFKTRKNADEFKDEYQEYLKDWDKQQNKVINGSANKDGKDPTRTHTWARGQGSIALGSRSIAFDDFTTAVGTLATARGKYSTAIGSGTLAYGEKSLAIGNEAYVYYDNGIAIGNNVQALSDQSMVYGRDAYAAGKGSLAIGSYASANVALNDDYWKLLNIYEGESDYLTMNQFLNQNLPEALAKENVQSWFKPKTELQEGSGEYKIIQAKDANVKILADGSSSYDMEYLGNTKIPKRIDYSKGYVNNGAIAIGSYVTARGDNSLAIGRFAFARDDRAFAIGQGAYGGGRESFAIGYGTKAIGPLSVALGALSRAEGINSFAIGGYSSAYGNNAMVIGYKATSEEGRYVVDNDKKSPDGKTKQKFEAIENTLAIGNYSNVNMSNSIALGFKSKTDYNPDDLKKQGYTPKGSFSIPSSIGAGVLSVGVKGSERRISNVAPGYLDTDAVNVSQLKALEDKMTMSFDENNISMPYISIKDDGKNYAKEEQDFKTWVKLKAMELQIENREKNNGETFDPKFKEELKAKIEAIEKSNQTDFKDKETKLLSEIKDTMTKNDEIAAKADNGKEASPEEKREQFDKITKQIEENKNKLLNGKGILTEEEKKELATTNWQGNKAEGKNSIAIGYKAMTDNNAENSVAVGNMSEAKEAKVFSVGSDSLKRRVVNVEKGKIDTTSYDAINGSQLYALASKIGLTVNGATGGTGNTQNNTDFGDLGITLTSVKNNNGANTGGTGTAPGNGVTNGSTIKNKPTTIKEAIESLDKVIASVMSKESYIEFEGNSSNGTATAPQPTGTTAQNAGDNIRVVKKVNGADGKDATLEIKLTKDLKNLDTVTIGGNQMTGGNTTTQGNGKQTVLTSEKIEIGKALNGNAGSGSTNDKAPITLDTTQKDSPKIEFATTNKDGKKQGTGQISGLKDISDEEAKKDPTLATNVKFVQDEVKKSEDKLNKKIEDNNKELTEKFNAHKAETTQKLETTKKEFNDKIKGINDAKPFDYYTEDGKKIVKVKENKDGKDIYKFYEAKEDGSKGDKEVAIEQVVIKAEPTDQVMKITNVKEGNLKAGSTDAVNAGQLFTATGMNPNPALSTEDALKKQQESAEKLSAAKKKYEELVKQKPNNKEELNKAIEGIFEAEKNDTPKYVFADGKDGQYGGKGKDGKANNAGATGLTAKDGLNGLNPNDKANAIRNGEAGTLVYTNEKGERLVKGNDGKYYKAGDVSKDGLVRPNAEAQTAQLSLVNTNGESAGNAIALNNLKSALGLDDKKENAEQEKQEIEKLEKEIETAKADVKTKQQEAEKLKAELEKTQTPKGINGGVDTAKAEEAKKRLEEAEKALTQAYKTLSEKQTALNDKAISVVKNLLEAKEENDQLNQAVNKKDLQAVAKARLNFKGNQGEMIHKALTETLEIVGFGREKDQKVFIGTENNIDVAGKDGKLVVTLNQDLNGMNTFETKDEDGKKSILDKSGLRVVDGNNIGIHNADGVHVGSKGNDGYLDPDQPKASFTKDGVEIVGKDKQTAKYGVDDIKLDDKKGNSVTIDRAGTTLKDDKGHTAGYKVDGATLKDKQGNESMQNANGLTVKDDKGHTATHAAASSTLHDGKGNTATHSAVATTLKDNEGNATTHTAKGSTVSNKEGDSAQYGANKVTMKDKNGKENVVIDAAKGTMQIGDKITLNGNKGHLTVPDVTPQTPGNAVVNKNYVDIKTNDLQNQLNVSNKELRAGVAAAMAMGSLYKPSLPGKSTLSVGVGTYKGENAVAVGYSKLSDNAKFGLNVSFSSNSVGDKGGAASIGYQW